MASKKRSNIHFEVIAPLEDDPSKFGWTLYKGKQRIVCKGTADTIEEARQAIAKERYNRNITC